MQDNQNVNVPPNVSDQNDATPSMIADIIKASQTSINSSIEKSSLQESISDPNKIAKSPREPISPALFMKMIGSLFFVAIVFFGSFLAYIAFNPSQAVFFVNTFNIDPNDIKNLLKELINGTFGFMMVVLSIAWIITLFRAFWTPKDLKRKRLLSWLLSGVTGFILFGVLAFWAYLFDFVNANDYDNPTGSTILYDQAQYREESLRDRSRIWDTQNLIGPIDIFFDIRSNASLIAKRNFVTIEGYQIDFDGAICNNDKSIITGSNPANEQSLVCTFDDIKPYNITGTYTVRDAQGVTTQIPIILPSIEIRGLVNIKKQENNRGQSIVTLDASSLKRFGQIEWTFAESNRVVTESSITETVNTLPKLVGLKVFQKNGFDRVFVLVDSEKKIIEGSIQSIQDTTDNRVFQFSLSGLTVNPNEITDIEWLLENQTVMCDRGDEQCNYTFTSYGRKDISAIVTLASGKKYTFNTEVSVNQPLNLVRHIKVFDRNGEVLNTDGTYDPGTRAFILKNTIIPPESLTFDARDVVSGNPGYTLEGVTWKIKSIREEREVRGLKVDIEFSQPLRYTVEGILQFRKSIPGQNDTEEIVRDTVIVDIERKNIMPRLDISLESDYVPSLVTVDASQSESEKSEIKKFIFDFGEGRPPAEGDAIQQYQYLTPGDKIITLTVISEDGEKATIKKTIVLKDEVKKVAYRPSIATGQVGSTIDFEAIGTTGQIEEYIWNFGDNTPIERGYQVAHVFEKAGTYDITLTVMYPDGTQKSTKGRYTVIEGN